MPKKGKKGKKGSKKGKKGAKKSKKDEDVVVTAAANARIWENRLEVTERSRQEYRENAKRLMLENEALQNRMLMSEKDTMDVLTYLKAQDKEKDMQVERLQSQIQDVKREYRLEQQAVTEEFSRQINELQEQLGEKMREVDLLQSELRAVKEFRRKRQAMQKELDDIKEALQNANREHKASLARMEQKFFEEKMKLQHEANEKIGELADRAHTEAIANLEETTKSVYKENVRLSEALNYHLKEGDMLRKERRKMTEYTDRLQEEKEVVDMLAQEKIISTRQQEDVIRDLKEKLKAGEKSLTTVVREFDHERQNMQEASSTEVAAAKAEIAQLQRVIEMKSKEMVKVKRLAKNILEQRTDLERFFLQSLEQVKAEITANQEQYRKDAQLAYNQRMLSATAGKANFPKIRTFGQLEHSTNSVFRDIKAAEKLYGVQGMVDVADLTWEQKELVLRYLFARMNSGTGKASPLSKQAPLPPICTPPSAQEGREDAEVHDDNDNNDDGNRTFLTQTQSLAEMPELPQAQLS